MTPNTESKPDKQNYHASVVALNGHGILIQGVSGSGKTSLAFGLLEAIQRKGETAYFVSDDQILLSQETGQLIAEAPLSIQGKAEIAGFGITKVAYIPRVSIDLIVCVEPDQVIERMPENRVQTLLGIMVPSIDVPARHENQSIRIVLAKMMELFD